MNTNVVILALLAGLLLGWGWAFIILLIWAFS